MAGKTDTFSQCNIVCPLQGVDRRLFAGMRFLQ